MRILIPMWVFRRGLTVLRTLAHSVSHDIHWRYSSLLANAINPIRARFIDMLPHGVAVRRNI